MPTAGGRSQRDRRDDPARERRQGPWTHTPILVPILLQILGGLLALAAAGDVLERESAAADAIGSSEPDPTHETPVDETGSGGTDEVPPASSSETGNVPAGVKLAQGPLTESSRLSTSSRPAACGPGVSVSTATRLRGRLASFPARACGSPFEGSLSPLSPRGPPARSDQRPADSDQG